MKKYSMIQIKSEIHAELKEFCKERGYKISGLVESLIKEKIQTNKPTSNKVLSSNSN